MCKSKQKNSLNSYKEKIMDTIKFNELIENSSTNLKKINKSTKYVYVKDNEGYVFKIPENELNDSYTIITEK